MLFTTKPEILEPLPIAAEQARSAPSSTNERLIAPRPPLSRQRKLGNYLCVTTIAATSFGALEAVNLTDTHQAVPRLPNCPFATTANPSVETPTPGPQTPPETKTLDDLFPKPSSPATNFDLRRVDILKSWRQYREFEQIKSYRSHLGLDVNFYSNGEVKIYPERVETILQSLVLAEPQSFQLPTVIDSVRCFQAKVERRELNGMPLDIYIASNPAAHIRNLQMNHLADATEPLPRVFRGFTRPNPSFLGASLGSFQVVLAGGSTNAEIAAEAANSTLKHELTSHFVIAALNGPIPITAQAIERDEQTARFMTEGFSLYYQPLEKKPFVEFNVPSLPEQTL